MTPPLGLATISSTLLEAGHQTKLFDYNVMLWREFGAGRSDDLWSGGRYLDWAIDQNYQDKLKPMLSDRLKAYMEKILKWEPDLVGFSIFDTSYPCTKDAARILKSMRPELPIVFGGPGMVRSLFQSTEDLKSSHADFIVFGEGEKTIVELVNRLGDPSSLSECLGMAYLDSGTLRINEDRKNISLKEVRVPDFQGLDFSLYKYKMLPVMMSRGCVAKCTFCAETRFWKGFRVREAQITAEEMLGLKKQHGISEFYLSDSLINGNHRILNDLADLLIEADERIRWSGYARLDKNLTPELLEKLSRSGLYLMSFGLETGSQKIMDLMDKRTTVEVAERVIRDSFNAGIAVNVNLVVGFPGEGEQEFQETMDFLQRNERYIQSVSTGETLSVIAGTPLFEHPERFGILSKDGKIQYDQNGQWISVDGANTYAKRRERLNRLRNYLKTKPRIRWTPDGQEARYVPAKYFQASDNILGKFTPGYFRWKMGNSDRASPLAGGKFHVDFEFSDVKKVDSFRSEVLRAVEAVDQKREKKKVALCVSGGVGSEILGLALDQLSIPYDCFFLDIFGINSDAKKQLVRERSYFSGKKIHEIRLDRNFLFGEYGLEHFQKFGICFPDQIALSYLYEKIPYEYFIVSGSGSLDRNGKFFESLTSSEVVPMSVVFNLSSISPYLWACENARIGEFQFFASQPELMLSQVLDSRFYWKFPFNDWRTMVKEQFPELSVEPKVSNWQGPLGIQENYLFRSWLKLQSRHLIEVANANFEDYSTFSFQDVFKKFRQGPTSDFKFQGNTLSNKPSVSV